MRVLLIDDEPLFLRHFRRLAPTLDFEQEKDVPAGLMRLTESTFDVAVVDVCLWGAGDASGLLFPRAARELPWAGGVVMLSGVLGDGLSSAAERAGADAWLDKRILDGPSLVGAIDEAASAHMASPRKADLESLLSLPTDLRALVTSAQNASAHKDLQRALRSLRIGAVARAAATGADAPRMLQACARLLGISDEGMRQYVQVTLRWSASELLELLLAQRGKNGFRITISHLAALTELPRPAREAWVERILREALTVHDVRRLVAERAHDNAAGALPATSSATKSSSFIASEASSRRHPSSSKCP